VIHSVTAEDGGMRSASRRSSVEATGDGMCARLSPSVARELRRGGGEEARQHEVRGYAGGVPSAGKVWQGSTGVARAR